MLSYTTSLATIVTSSSSSWRTSRHLQPSHAVDSEAVYREGCGGWGRHNLVLALSKIEDVDIVSLCAGKEAVFLGKNRLGTFPIPSRWRACTVGWSTRWYQLPLFPWRWGPCHSPGLTRHEGAAERWDEVTSWNRSTWRFLRKFWFQSYLLAEDRDVSLDMWPHTENSISS